MDHVKALHPPNLHFLNWQAARWNPLDRIPGVFRIFSGARPRHPLRDVLQLLLGKGVFTGVGGTYHKWFLKGSRILLLRRCLWRTSRTPQRGLRKPQSPEQTHLKVREGGL